MKHNLGLDGLRGIAALNVAIYHFLLAVNLLGLDCFTQNNNLFLKPVFLVIGAVFFNGHLAVIVFFVLSGYVLSLPYYNNREDLVLKKRIWGRYLRLNIPIVFATLISYLIYKSNLYFNIDAAKISGSLFISDFNNPISLSTLFEESFYKSILFGYRTLVPQLWTLNIEFIGSIYLLFYYVCKPKKFTGISSIFVFFYLYLTYHGGSIYFIAIFLGSFLNVVKIDNPSIKLLTLIIGLYFAAFQLNCIFYNFLPDITLGNARLFESDKFYNTIGALLITAAVANGVGRNFLQHKIIQFLGRISFSLYILHFSVLCSISCYFYITHAQTSILIFINFIIFLAICFIASTLFEKYIDRPATKLSHKVSEFMSNEQARLIPEGGFKYSVYTAKINCWKKQALTYLLDIFREKKKQAHTEYEIKMVELYEQIEQLKNENNFLKRNSRELSR